MPFESMIWFTIVLTFVGSFHIEVKHVRSRRIRKKLSWSEILLDPFPAETCSNKPCTKGTYSALFRSSLTVFSTNYSMKSKPYSVLQTHREYSTNPKIGAVHIYCGVENWIHGVAHSISSSHILWDHNDEPLQLFYQSGYHARISFSNKDNTWADRPWIFL